MENKLTFDQIRSVIIGHAVGDALGVPVEFVTREELEKDPVTDMEGFGTYPFPAGCWSDDTSMTLCALESLSRKVFDLDDVMQNFGKWYYKDEFTPTGEAFDVGNTCSNAIHNYFVKRMSYSECGLNTERSNGNGSIMRIAPFALFGYTKPNMFKHIIESGSALTHAHMRSIIGCNIYSHILLKILDNRSKSAVFEGIKESALCYKEDENRSFYEGLENIGSKSIDEISSTGYVVDTLEAALWCLLNTDSYEECVLKAVNLGDDTDSVAAVAGALAGALYGYESIPEKWRMTLKRREYIESLCKAAAENW